MSPRNFLRRTVIDVGSNSILCLIAEQDANGWNTLYESTAVTGLGTGTRETGTLQENEQHNSLRALKDAFTKAREFESPVVALGTMALRIAKNADAFCDRAAQQGTPVTVISGELEAQLGYESVRNDPRFSSIPELAIIDPGGHSTELVIGNRYQRSFSLGALGLREHEVLTPQDVFQLTLHVDSILGENLPSCPNSVVLGAIGTNLVSIREALTAWMPERVHGQWLEYEEISRAVAWLSPMTDAQRAQTPGLEKGREKTIHLGALILERFLYAIRAEGCWVSVRGWRHAVLDHEEFWL